MPLPEGTPMKLLALLPFVLVACSSTPAKKADHFEGMRGCFLLYNLKTQSLEAQMGEEAFCNEQLPASSSFKVPLAVMAFDSGVLKDENTVLKWDGKKRELKTHNQDHNGKTWMRDSVIWFSQDVSKKMGKKKLQKYLKDFDYGNQDLSGGLTTAWILRADDKGALKISANEQLEFMKKLWGDSLPASKRAMQIARDITFLEESPNGYKLHGKTGSNFYDKERNLRIGWFVSHLQKGDQQYIAISTFSDRAPSENKGYGGGAAKEITKKIFAEKGLW